MGDDDKTLQSLPLASDSDVMIFLKGSIAFTGFHFAQKVLRHRLHIKSLRFATWGVPLAFFCLWTTMPVWPYEVICITYAHMADCVCVAYSTLYICVLNRAEKPFGALVFVVNCFLTQTHDHTFNLRTT